MDLGIQDRVAFVTGAAGGIGARAAEMLAEEGALVAIGDINPDAAEAEAARLRDTGFTAIAVQVDVASAASVDQAVAAVSQALAPVDILVNNAGFTRDKRIGRMEESDWDSVVDVVLKGAFLCTKSVLPGMIEKKWGRIVNISSRAYLGNPGQANYSSAKAGLLGLTRSMALENGRYNITVNAVAPGIIDTAAVRNLPHFEKIRTNAEASLPLPRLGRVEDVAAAIVFLASEQAGYITGDVVHVSGGRYG
ncbi:3-oxoacyl-ACP reductase FabG [Sphingobium amiense]|uniref:3-oxoacyl-ACP reductase FabG n=1 Tax=Sphingobium amiense TaxID=135719 RepID=A0A494W5X8_9SPHN|nr:3-oxoacyl-ACP reductase FabG [Sphingobium amiense]BBD99651.1 3-oxoacyl-ACP reductase FabG [Sphingobium amiense]